MWRYYVFWNRRISRGKVGLAAGTLYPDDPIFYSQEVRFFLNGDEFAVEPYRFLVLVHFEGDWYVQDDGKIGDN